MAMSKDKSERFDQLLQYPPVKELIWFVYSLDGGEAWHRNVYRDVRNTNFRFQDIDDEIFTSMNKLGLRLPYLIGVNDASFMNSPEVHTFLCEFCNVSDEDIEDYAYGVAEILTRAGDKTYTKYEEFII